MAKGIERIATLNKTPSETYIWGMYPPLGRWIEMSHPRQQNDTLPYWVAEDLQKISRQLPKLVALPESEGERFGREVRMISSKLAQLRRAMIARGLDKEGSHVSREA